MTKRYVYSGYIEIEYKTLISIMKNVLKASNVRDRYAGDVEKTIHYKDDNLDVYAYEDDLKGFLWQAEYEGTFEGAQASIDTLTSKLREENISHQFEWNEVNENDEQIGEEYEIKFPD